MNRYLVYVGNELIDVTNVYLNAKDYASKLGYYVKQHSKHGQILSIIDETSGHTISSCLLR